MDTIQAAILLEKLKIFDDELQERQQIATRYNESLSGIVDVPLIPEGKTSAWAQYTIKLPPSMVRETVIRDLREAGIPTMIYYEKPLHLQTAYKDCPTSSRLEISKSLSQTVLSLPMSATLNPLTLFGGL